MLSQLIRKSYKTLGPSVINSIKSPWSMVFSSNLICESLQLVCKWLGGERDVDKTSHHCPIPVSDNYSTSNYLKIINLKPKRTSVLLVLGINKSKMPFSFAAQKEKYICTSDIIRLQDYWSPFLNTNWWNFNKKVSFWCFYVR